MDEFVPNPARQPLKAGVFKKNYKWQLINYLVSTVNQLRFPRIVSKYWSHHWNFMHCFSWNNSLFSPLTLIWEFYFHLLTTLGFKSNKMDRGSIFLLVKDARDSASMCLLHWHRRAPDPGMSWVGQKQTPEEGSQGSQGLVPSEVWLIIIQRFILFTF